MPLLPGQNREAQEYKRNFMHVSPKKKLLTEIGEELVLAQVQRILGSHRDSARQTLQGFGIVPRRDPSSRRDTYLFSDLRKIPFLQLAYDEQGNRTSWPIPVIPLDTGEVQLAEDRCVHVPTFLSVQHSHLVAALQRQYAFEIKQKLVPLGFGLDTTKDRRGALHRKADVLEFLSGKTKKKPKRSRST